MRLDDLTELQRDALREVGSIGSGHAATALSQLTGRGIAITVPTLEILSITEVPRVVGGPEELVGAVYSRLLGDVAGGIMFMAGRDSSLELCDMLHGRPAHTTKSFGHAEEAVITHVASVLSSAYLAAIARLTDMSILPASPVFALDMAGAILGVVTSDVAMKAESAVLVRASFSAEDDPVDAMLFFLPDPDSLEALLGRLGVV